MNTRELRSQVLEILSQNMAMNGYEICRAINGIEDPLQCHMKSKDFGGIRGWGCASSIWKCCVPYNRVISQLHYMMEKGWIQSIKMRWLDSTKIGTDLFRFFYLHITQLSKKLGAVPLDIWI